MIFFFPVNWSSIYLVCYILYVYTTLWQKWYKYNYIVIDICQIVCMRMASQEWATSVLNVQSRSDPTQSSLWLSSDRAELGWLVQECFSRTGGELFKTSEVAHPWFIYYGSTLKPSWPPFHVTFCRVKINLFHWHLHNFFFFFWVTLLYSWLLNHS